jgi:hypothetical protein
MSMPKAGRTTLARTRNTIYKAMEMSRFATSNNPIPFNVLNI